MILPTSQWQQQLEALSGLFVIATPIGHREDITLRALVTLNAVDAIFCEDTRQAHTLLATYGIQKKCFAFHAHNEESSIQHVLSVLQDKQRVALISDRGTPLISDPGYTLVRACHEKQIPVHFLPGACALIMGVVLSGIACQHFTFCGFLPKSKAHRLRALEPFKEAEQALVFYEAPHRLKEALADMRCVLGNRNACVLRELTKKFEERRFGPLEDLVLWAQEDAPKGEMVLVIEGGAPLHEKEDLLDALLAEHSGPLSPEVIKEWQKKTGCSRNTIYQKHLALKKSTS